MTSRIKFGLFRVANSGDTVKINEVSLGEHFTDVAGNLYYKRHDTGQVLLIAGPNTANSSAWANITGKPTTLSGYGVTLSSSDIPTLDKSKINFGSSNTLSTFGITLSSTDIPNSGVTAGTYTKVVVNGKGIVTSGSNITNSDLPNSSITAGTYTKITFNSKGIATTGSNLLEVDIPTLDKSKINFGTGNSLSTFGISLVETDIPNILSLDIANINITNSLTENVGNLNVGTQATFNAISTFNDLTTFTDTVRIGVIRNFSTLADDEILRKDEMISYVQTVASVGLTILSPVIAATTVNITLSGLQTIDGVSLVLNQRVLVKDQTDKTENGIYLAKSGSWVRDTDLDVDSELKNNLYVYVESGSVNNNTSWVTSGLSVSPVLGTDDINFSKFFASEEITASGGLVKTGADISIANVSGLSAGTYTKVTVNSKGQVVVGSTLSSSDIPTLDKSKINFGTGNSLSTFGISLNSSDIPTLDKSKINFGTGNSLSTFGITGGTGGANSQALDGLTLSTYKLIGTSSSNTLALISYTAFTSTLLNLSNKNELLTLVGTNEANWITRDVYTNPPSNQTVNGNTFINVLNVLTDLNTSTHFIYTDLTNTSNNKSGVYTIVLNTLSISQNFRFKITNSIFGLNSRKIKIVLDNNGTNSFIREFASESALKNFITIEPGYTYELVAVTSNYFKATKIQSIFDNIDIPKYGVVPASKALSAIQGINTHNNFKNNTLFPFYDYTTGISHYNIDNANMVTTSVLHFVNATGVNATSSYADVGTARLFLNTSINVVYSRNSTREIITVSPDISHTLSSSNPALANLTSVDYNSFNESHIYVKEDSTGNNKLHVSYSKPKFISQNKINSLNNEFANVLDSVNTLHETNPTKMAVYNTLRRLTNLNQYDGTLANHTKMYRVFHRFGMRHYCAWDAYNTDSYLQINDDCGRFGFNYNVNNESFPNVTGTSRVNLSHRKGDLNAAGSNYNEEWSTIEEGVFNKALLCYANDVDALSFLGKSTTYSSQAIAPIQGNSDSYYLSDQAYWATIPNFDLRKHFPMINLWFKIPDISQFDTINIGGVLKSFSPNGYVNNPNDYRYLILFEGHKLGLNNTQDTTYRSHIVLGRVNVSGVWKFRITIIHYLPNGSFTVCALSNAFDLISNRWYNMNFVFKVQGNDSVFTTTETNPINLWTTPYKVYLNATPLTLSNINNIPYSITWNKMFYINDGTGRAIRVGFDEVKFSSLQISHDSTGVVTTDINHNTLLDEIALYNYKEASVTLIDKEFGLPIYGSYTPKVFIGKTTPILTSAFTNQSMSSNITVRRFGSEEPPRIYQVTDSEEILFTNLGAAELGGKENVIIARTFFGQPIEVEAYLKFASSPNEYKIPLNAVTLNGDPSLTTSYTGFSCAIDNSYLGELITIKWGKYPIPPAINGVISSEVSTLGQVVNNLNGVRFNLRLVVSKKFQ